MQSFDSFFVVSLSKIAEQTVELLVVQDIQQGSCRSFIFLYFLYFPLFRFASCFFLYFHKKRREFLFFPVFLEMTWTGPNVIIFSHQC